MITVSFPAHAQPGEVVQMSVDGKMERVQLPPERPPNGGEITFNIDESSSLRISHNIKSDDKTKSHNNKGKAKKKGKATKTKTYINWMIPVNEIVLANTVLLGITEGISDRKLLAGITSGVKPSSGKLSESRNKFRTKAKEAEMDIEEYLQARISDLQSTIDYDCALSQKLWTEKDKEGTITSLTNKKQKYKGKKCGKTVSCIYQGVSKLKKEEKYESQIITKGITCKLGSYKLSCDAAFAYDSASKLLHGCDTPTNFSSLNEYSQAREAEESRVQSESTLTSQDLIMKTIHCLRAAGLFDKETIEFMYNDDTGDNDAEPTSPTAMSDKVSNEDITPTQIVSEYSFFVCNILH